MVALMWGHLIYGQEEPRARCSSEDSVMVERIHNHVLGQGGCVDDLRVLCKEVGARLSGSPEADAAILWGAKTLREAGAPDVRMLILMTDRPGGRKV